MVPLTSRLYSDELAILQKLVGAVVNLKDPHRLQSLQSIGLGPVSTCGAVDFVKMTSYLASCSLAVLEEVAPDQLVLTRMDPAEAYRIRNIYKPFLPWDSHSQLCVIPPIFGGDSCKIPLESNGCVLILPTVVPRDVAQDILQKLLIKNIYTRLAASDPAINLGEIDMYTGTVSYLGVDYVINTEAGQESALSALDNLAMYTCILMTLIPRACARLSDSLIRSEEHELLQLFRRMLPDELQLFTQNNLDVQDDLLKMNAFMTYAQSISTIFNLGRVLHVATYEPESLTASCWCGYE